jgi:hypothetical protein
LFGDTFFTPAAADGYTWRSSSWSWTDDADPTAGLNWTHALDNQGKPIQALPHTRDEQAFDDAHNGNPCPAGTGCGERHTPWPAGAFVTDPQSGQAWVFYSLEYTEPTGAFSFTGEGTGIALWPSPAAPASRQVVNVISAEPTLLFGANEPGWGSGGLLFSDGLLYVYAWYQGATRLARVDLIAMFDRTAWQFWTGSAWDADWTRGAEVFDGAPYVSIVFNAYVGHYLAWYMPPLDNTIRIRWSDRPEGPWSEDQVVGKGMASQSSDVGWDYALVAHPEFDNAKGQTTYLSYFQPGTFLNGTVNLVRVDFR